jgi:hypothetical protein
MRCAIHLPFRKGELSDAFSVITLKEESGKIERTVDYTTQV